MSKAEDGGTNNSIVFIDAGSALVRVAEAAKTELGVSFSALGAERVLERKKPSAAELGEIIKSLIASAGIVSREAVFALSGSSVMIRHIDFPKMPPEAIDKNIRNELKKELGAAVDSMSFHHLVIKEFDAKNEDGSVQKKMKVLVCALEPKSVSHLREAAAAAGLSVRAAVSSDLGFYSMAKKMGALDTLLQDEVLLFLDFGNSQITTNFVSRDGLRFSKDINMGGATLTTVIKTLNSGGAAVTATEAEDMKFRIGILPQEKVDGLDDSAPEANLHKVLNVSFRKLLQRVRLSTGYFFAHFKESVSFQALKAIYLYGGNCAIPGVREFFADYYGAAIIKINCWDAAAAEGCDPDLKERYNLSFAVICAAAHEYFYPEYSLNFIEEKKAAGPAASSTAFSAEDFIAKNLPAAKYLARYGTLNVIVALALFYAAVFGSIAAWSQWQIHSARSEKAEKKAAATELESPAAKAAREKIEKEYAAYTKKKNAIEIIKFKNPSFASIMKAVSDCMPDDVALKSVRLENDGGPSLTMSGTAAVYASALGFGEALRKKKETASMTVKKVEQIGSAVEFQLEMKPGTEDAR